MKPNKLSESIIYFSCKNIHIHYSTQLGMFKSHIIYYDWKSSICSDIKKRQLLVQLLLCKYKFIDHKHKEEKYFSTSTVLSTTSVQIHWPQAQGEEEVLQYKYSTEYSVQIHWPQAQGGEVLQYKYSTEYYIDTNSLTTSTKRRRSTSVQVQYWVLHQYKFIDNKHKEEKKYFSTSTVLSTTSFWLLLCILPDSWSLAGIQST